MHKSFKPSVLLKKYIQKYQNRLRLLQQEKGKPWSAFNLPKKAPMTSPSPLEESNFQDLPSPFQFPKNQSMNCSSSLILPSNLSYFMMPNEMDIHITPSTNFVIKPHPPSHWFLFKMGLYLVVTIQLTGQEMLVKMLRMRFCFH